MLPTSPSAATTGAELTAAGVTATCPASPRVGAQPWFHPPRRPAPCRRPPRGPSSETGSIGALQHAIAFLHGCCLYHNGGRFLGHALLKPCQKRRPSAPAGANSGCAIHRRQHGRRARLPRPLRPPANGRRLVWHRLRSIARQPRPKWNPQVERMNDSWHWLLPTLATLAGQQRFDLLRKWPRGLGRCASARCPLGNPWPMQCRRNSYLQSLAKPLLGAVPGESSMAAFTTCTISFAAKGTPALVRTCSFSFQEVSSSSSDTRRSLRQQRVMLAFQQTSWPC